MNALTDTCTHTHTPLAATEVLVSCQSDVSRVLSLPRGFGSPYPSPSRIESVSRPPPWDPANDLAANTTVKPKYFFIPRVRQTAIEVNFSRNDLEEFMDRCV